MISSNENSGSRTTRRLTSSRLLHLSSLLLLRLPLPSSLLSDRSRNINVHSSFGGSLLVVHNWLVVLSLLSSSDSLLKKTKRSSSVSRLVSSTRVRAKKRSRLAHLVPLEVHTIHGLPDLLLRPFAFLQRSVHLLEREVGFADRLGPVERLSVSESGFVDFASFGECRSTTEDQRGSSASTTGRRERGERR